MVNMKDLANHIIALTTEQANGVSNLQLQKIMFLIFGKNISDFKKGAVDIKISYDSPFSRWTYGPVVEDIYYTYNMFGPNVIRSDKATTTDELDIYNEYILQFSEVDPFKLVEITHNLPSWSKYKDHIMDRKFVPPYDEEEIAREFGNIVQ